MRKNRAKQRILESVFNRNAIENQILISIQKISEMRKKQANRYQIQDKFKTIPYLTKHELTQFESQFSLFDTELDLTKLKESFLIFNTTLLTTENYRPIQSFVNSISTKKDKCSFSDYIESMKKYFQKMGNSDFFMQILSQNKGNISQVMIHQILEQILGRQISENEIRQIIQKVFAIQNINQPIPREKIMNLLSQTCKKS